MITSLDHLGASYWEHWHDYAYLLGVGVLCALTVYRKQLSSNRCFHQEEGDANNERIIGKKMKSNNGSTLLEMEAEELLESAGLTFSGAPILSLAYAWMECFPGEDIDNSKLLWLQDSALTTSDLLEKAGNYCSVELIATILFFFLNKKSEEQESCISSNTKEFVNDPFHSNFPPDIHVNIVSFLHPRDVVSLACVSKKCNEMIESSSSETSRAIWKTLWRRDYAWVVHDWQVGKDALKRSGMLKWDNPDKQFYFLFGQTYMNWILAGQNSSDRCLVGLHCNIYDITSFLDTHPGSPDTLMAYSGKDSTRFFEDMGHSLGARRMAKSLCVVKESSSKTNDWGLNRTNLGENNLLLGRKQRRRVGTLQSVLDYLEVEEVKVRRKVMRSYSKDPNVLGGQVNIYFDPFLREWRIWYTDQTLNNVFAPA